MLLEMENLRKSYGGQPVVDVAHFALEPGCVCGLVGANGAGKTTLMRMVIGLARPDAGCVRFPAGRPQIGCLIDRPVLDEEMSVAQNLALGARLRGLPRGAADEVMTEMELEAFSNKRPRQLSQGMRQKAALALAFLGRPALIVLDEPANGLDPPAVRRLRAYIARRGERDGCAFLISSHMLDELSRTVDRCAVMNRGRLEVLEDFPGGAGGDDFERALLLKMEAPL